MIEANMLFSPLYGDVMPNIMQSYPNFDTELDPILQNSFGRQFPYDTEDRDIIGDDVETFSSFTVLRGGAQRDRLVGEAGHNFLLGAGGSDLLMGNAGNDELRGGRDDDVLQGEAGRDLLIGGEGNDQLDGGSGFDRLEGGSGDDTLTDFEGGDRLKGGRGRDRFRLGKVTAFAPTIVRDFQVGVDRLQILRLGASFDSLEFQRTRDGMVVMDDGKNIALLQGVKQTLDADSFLFERVQAPVTLASEPDAIAESTAQSLQQILDRSRLAPAESVYVSSPLGTFAGASGVQSVATNDPVQTNDLFEIGSITKNFTSVLVLKLADAGLLSLDDTLGQLVPDIAALIPDGNDITLRDALNGSAGIPTFVNRLTEEFLKGRTEFAPEELVEFVEGVPRYTGDRVSLAGDWVYPDTGHVIAGIIVERITGNTYSEELRRRVLEPLELTDTFTSLEAGLPLDRVATGYTDVNGDRIPDDVSTGINIGRLSFSDGAVLSTPRDVARFARGLVQSDFLSEAARRELTATVNAEEDPGSGIRYGVGTAVAEDTPFGKAYFFSGSTNGYSATYLYLPDLDVVYAAVQNAAPEFSESPVTNLQFEQNPILLKVFEDLAASSEG